MKKTLSGYSLMAALLLGLVSAPLAAQNASENAAVTALAKLDTPVLLFKTTAKDPYFMFHRPGSSTLETVIFGYYSGTGAHVQRVTKAREQLSHLIPIRMTKFFAEGPVKIDEKYVGWRESVVAKTYEDIFKAVGVISDLSYKGTPFVDQYLEAVPMKWVFNNAAEFASFRLFIQPLFESHNLLVQGLPKPVLVVEFEGPKAGELSAGDYEFLENYFTLIDLTNEIARVFFAEHQKQILEAVVKCGDKNITKQVKEGLVDIMFREMESVTKEFKAKELFPIIIGTVVSAITVEVMKDYLKEITKHAKNHAHARIVDPVMNKVAAAAAVKHPVRDGALIAGGVVGAGILLTAGACAATAA